MGQKINPIGFRLGINRGWDSTWFAKKKDFGKYLIEDFKIRNYIKKNITNSGVSEIMIERSSKKCTVSIHTSRPGFVIGKKVDVAIRDLQFSAKRITKDIRKTISSAVANAENNFQYDIDSLIVKEAYCGKKIVMKRFRPRAKGRAAPILKPWSTVTIILSEVKQMESHGTKS